MAHFTMFRSSIIVSVFAIFASSTAAMGQGTECRSGDTEQGVEETTVFLQVTREKDLTLDDVKRIIDEFECFQQMPDRSGVNPMTNEPVVFSGERGGVYVVGGEGIGNFVLENGRIFFTNVPELLVQDVAELISATVQPWDAS